MEMKFRKLLPLVGAVCLGLTSSSFAHESNQSTYGSAADQDMQSGQGSYQRGTFREITPSAGPRVAHGADVFLTANFIWWNVKEDGLIISNAGGRLGVDQSDVGTMIPSGGTASVGQTWSPGFKVGLGVNLPHDGWDLFAEYIWLRPSDSGDQSNPSNIPFDFRRYSLPNDGTNSFTKSESDWRHRFNVINLEIGRNFYLSQYLTMRPFMGLKGTWQRRRLNSTYTGVFNADANKRPGNFTDRHRFRAWGVGVRGGLNTAWYVTKSFSVYGNLAFSALWTDYNRIRQRTQLNLDKTEQQEASTTDYVNVTDTNNHYTCRFVSELELGLRWETWFYDDNYHFSIQAGWEQQVWHDWSLLFDGTASSERFNNLSTQGLNLQLRFGF